MLDLCWYRWCGCVLSRTNNILEIVPRLEKTIWFVLLNSFTHHLQLQTRFSLVLVRNWGIYSFMYYWGETPRLVTIVNRLSIFRVDITYWLQIGSNINVQHEEMILSMLLKTGCLRHTSIHLSRFKVAQRHTFWVDAWASCATIFFSPHYLYQSTLQNIAIAIVTSSFVMVFN